ncbi:MAG: aminoacyl--tRNA ligase-related protein [Candidatus Uhrbacteria bacterium]|nr:aminoacyl--tRNA ligase-related protein [Candidatus Uhrbacteria bacterium]
MKQSQLFTKTSKSAPADADSANARLLTQAGFINQLAAGIYTYLPLGLKALNKIKAIVREEMDAIGGQEILMPALHPKQLYDATGRWDKIDVMFKVEGAGDKEYGLSSTAEEVITPLVRDYVKSYKDLPVAVYQIQDKFINEPRAKSGLLRGREFSMKDLYSFHTDEQDFLDFYEKAKGAYLKIYSRCGLDAIVAAASGGVFTDKNSHEFQVPTEAGEDSIYVDKKTGVAMNKEIVPKADLDNTEKYDIVKSIEVGNIFPLECRFSDSFDFKVTGADGKPMDVIMGCYGIGPSRVMGSIVEVHHDDRGMIWPKSVAPFAVHLVSLSSKDSDLQSRIDDVSEDLYNGLLESGVEVLWDDRSDMSPGAKFGDADLIGLPLRLVVSEKTLREDSVEWKERASEEMQLIELDKIKEAVQTWVKE